jgi:hypothetical protein
MKNEIATAQDYAMNCGRRLMLMILSSSFTVHLPNDTQWLSTRLLRSHTHHAQQPLFACDSNLDFRTTAEPPHQHSRRRVVWNSRRLPRQSILSCQNSITIFLTFPTRWNSTSVQKCRRWTGTDMAGRGYSRTLAWSRAGHDPDGLRQ